VGGLPWLNTADLYGVKPKGRKKIKKIKKSFPLRSARSPAREKKIWMKISLWVFKIRGFEGGIGVPNRGGPLNSTGAGLLNHQTSKISINSIWMKISLWVFKIRGFEGGIRIPKHGGPRNSTRVELLNHQTSKIV
jgi:hypothetical protein